MSGNALFLINLLATWYLVGLIWMVQIVHYKLYDRVGEAAFVGYEEDHNRLITPIVGPPMLIELATCAMMLFWSPTCMPRWAVWLGLALVVAIWLSTAFIQVPCHSKLLKGFDATACRMLMNSNWIRTVSWSARGALTGYFAWRLISNGAALA